MRVLSDERIRHTESEWRALVKQFEASGQSEAAFCRAGKLSRRSFREWRKRLAAVDGGARRLRATRKPKSPPAGFVEWAVPSKGAEPRSGAEFELSLPGGVLLRWRA
jgi:hypothetical protein